MFSPSHTLHTKPFNDVFDIVVAHDNGLLLKVEDSNREHLARLNVIISQTVTDMVNIYFANTGSRLLAFDWYVYIWHLSTIKVKVKLIICQLQISRKR